MHWLLTQLCGACGTGQFSLILQPRVYQWQGWRLFKASRQQGLGIKAPRHHTITESFLGSFPHSRYSLGVFVHNKQLFYGPIIGTGSLPGEQKRTLSGVPLFSLSRHKTDQASLLNVYTTSPTFIPTSFLLPTALQASDLIISPPIDLHLHHFGPHNGGVSVQGGTLLIACCWPSLIIWTDHQPGHELCHSVSLDTRTLSLGPV